MSERGRGAANELSGGQVKVEKRDGALLLLACCLFEEVQQRVHGELTQFHQVLMGTDMVPHGGVCIDVVSDQFLPIACKFSLQTELPILPARKI